MRNSYPQCSEIAGVDPLNNILAKPGWQQEKEKERERAAAAAASRNRRIPDAQTSASSPTAVQFVPSIHYVAAIGDSEPRRSTLNYKEQEVMLKKSLASKTGAPFVSSDTSGNWADQVEEETPEAVCSVL